MTDQEIRLKFGEMNAGEMRLARALVAWHEREIANLKAALPDRPQAVAAVVLAQAVRRMEAVPQEEIWKVYKDAPHRIAKEALESVRARLIAAARGEGQAQSVVANEPLQDEGQPDLSGESEKQSLPCVCGSPTDVGTVHRSDRPCYQAKDQPTTSPSWTPTAGDVVRSTPEMALGGQMYWRDLALQLARVWWKCYKIGASLQHGDLDKDIAFSIVCERHGGRVFHSDTPENALNKAEEWLLSPDRENFPAACLTPAKP